MCKIKFRRNRKIEGGVGGLGPEFVFQKKLAPVRKINKTKIAKPVPVETVLVQIL
mgnify:FL=1